MIVLDERHLQRLLSEYVTYYHDNRTHLGLDKEAPAQRGLAVQPAEGAPLVSLPRVGGLHHRYEWHSAA